jgi:hypothetical protein
MKEMKIEAEPRRYQGLMLASARRGLNHDE